jgi:hypothetical protein
MTFTDEDIQQVWNKGTIISGYDYSLYRQDVCKAWMDRKQYGNRDSILGWEIDHIDPNGGDSLSNLRPLQWKNNATRQDGKLTCPVTSDGNKNIDRG